MTVRSHDVIGNTAEYTRTVTVDNDGPAVAFAPAANTLVRGTFTTALTSAKDATGITYFSGYLDNLAYTHRAPIAHPGPSASTAAASPTAAAPCRSTSRTKPAT